MHEFSMAMEMVRAVLKELKDRQVERVLSIELELGELTSVNPDQLKFCFEIASKQTLLEDAALKILKKAAVISCPCGFKGDPLQGSAEAKAPISYFVCPKCGSGDVKVLSGRELSIKNIKYEGVSDADT